MLARFYQSTWRHIPKYNNVHSHSREKLKSHLVTSVWVSHKVRFITFLHGTRGGAVG
jgi:hypothetical protein